MPDSRRIKQIASIIIALVMIIIAVSFFYSPPKNINANVPYQPKKKSRTFEPAEDFLL